MKHTSFRLTLAASAISMTLSVYAQEERPKAAGAEEASRAQVDSAQIQKVEIKADANTYDPRRDDTAAKIIVNQEEIAKYGDANVLDVLRRVPGITVTSSNGRSGEIRMRGLGAGYTQILINGDRAPAGFSMDSLSPNMIERIEVLRAASAELSTQSIAGTINIVLKKAVRAGQRELKLGARHGSGFNGPSANLQLSDRGEKMSYSIGINALRERFERQPFEIEEGFDGKGNRFLLRDNTLSESGVVNTLNANSRLNWVLGGGETLTAQILLNMSRLSTDLHTLSSTLLGEPVLYPDYKSKQKNQSDFLKTELNWGRKFQSGSRLDVKVAGTYSAPGSALVRVNNGGPVDLYNSLDLRDTERGLISTGKFTASLGEKHTLAFGWDTGYSTRHNMREEQDLAWGTLSEVERYNADVTRAAVYVQDEWNITPRLSLYLGARWEDVRTEASGDNFKFAKSRVSVLSPIVQSLWKLPNTKNDQIRLAVTRTFKAPALQSLMPRRQNSINNSEIDPDFMGNPALLPELAVGFDASYDHYWAEGALFSISGSLRRIENNTRNLLGYEDGRWVVRPRNEGTARTRGLEIETKFPLKAIVGNAPAIDVRASLSRNWSEIASELDVKSRLDQTPLSATLGVDYKMGAFTTGGSLAFREGGSVRVARDQTIVLQTRHDLDLYMLWKFTPKNQFRLALTNVLAQDLHYGAIYNGPDGKSIRKDAVYPHNMNVRATLEMKF